ncbi:glycosyl hydrolase family 95 catalytic domain-containing protein [Catenulispora pinisilvae]|uniref:glycosyl hydrolase family 95 catalytic domain-containing protein n=1 Tax=Catenulispora pinisilvae TaxID=2705253 RepID=UPI00189230DF|nr:hypothetical protein [Catenulispora pinisilvae]
MTSTVSRRSVIAATAGAAGAASVTGVAFAAPASAGTAFAGTDAASTGAAGTDAPANAAADCGSESGVRWADVRRQLAAANPRVSAPIQKVVTNKYTPGMLLGNGDIGVVVGDSSAAQQSFHFGKSDFWGNNRKTTAPLSWQNSILPVGALTVAVPGATPAATGYSMVTDIGTAQVTSVLPFAGSTLTLNSWTADRDNVLITELSSAAGDADLTLNASVVLPNDPAYPSAAGVTGGALWLTRQNNAVGYGDVSYKASVASATVVVGGTFTAPSSTATTADGTFVLPGGGRAVLLTVFRSHGQDLSDTSPAPTPDQLRDQAIAAATSFGDRWLHDARATHHAYWTDFWTRSSVVFGDSQLETYYFNAQYVLGSGARSGVHNPPSLWAAWTTNDTPNWGGRYFLNYNEEALYYGAFSSNHAELSESYRRMILNEVAWQRNTTHNAGYQGTAFQRSLPPFHLYQTPPAPVPVAATKNYPKLPADQKSNATFGALPLIWHWEYTRDLDYLRTELYPLLKELDAFWRDFAVWDGTRWIFQHTSAHEGGDDTNPNLDLGFARKVVNTLLDTSAVLGVDADLRPVWTDFLAKLSAYPTGTYNGVTVFYTGEIINNPGLPDTFEPGNQPINMEGVIFPGEQCSIGGDAMLLQYANNSLTQMNSWGVTPGGNSNNGFCKEFVIAARVGWPAEDLFQKLKASIAYLWRPSNNTVFQGGGGVETTGTTEALNSMLMQSEDGVIRVFPCWPAARDASFTLQAKGAFLVGAEQRGGKVGQVRLHSRVGGDATLQLPWNTGSAQVVDESHGGRVWASASGGRVTWRTEAGHTYRVTPKGR